MSVSHPRLRPDVELLKGMDDHYLLFDAETGRYHRITPTSARLIRAMDGSRDISALADEILLYNVNRNKEVATFVSQLSEAKLLYGESPTKSITNRIYITPFLPRFLIFKNFSKIIEPISKLVTAIPTRIFYTIAIIGSLIGYAVGFRVFLDQTDIFSIRKPEIFLYALAMMTISILIHEAWHGIIAATYSQPVRGLGIVLFAWVLPIAYVDRTDAYRIKSRSARTAIALAGPISDGWLVGLTCLTIINSVHTFRETFTLLLAFQLTLLVSNFNPLMHSDGLNAIEAISGITDLRGRSFKIIKVALKIQTLPPYLKKITVAEKVFYFGYGTLCLLFSGVILVFMSYNLLLALKAISGIH